VPTLVELLTPVTPRIEAELKPRLQGLLGGFIRAYLPQQWVFQTEKGEATVRINPDGSVTVAEGAVTSPDVTIQAPHKRIEGILERGERPARPTPDVHVTAHTARGRAALDQVRGRFGV
jgi:hypothetical protein